MASATARSVSLSDLRDLCRTALRSAGASPLVAEALTATAVESEGRGHGEVGAAHVLDDIAALRAGRMNPDPHPAVKARRGSAIVADADEGPAQAAFLSAVDDVTEAARRNGVAVLSVHSAYSGGALGFYVRRLAERGLIALAAGNSAALMSVFGSRGPVTGTNPLAFAIPDPTAGSGGVRSFDQASSQTAWVAVRDAAASGEAIPEGWALDADGEPTTDAAAALRGAMLPFGGAKGANIAMMVELLAVLAGGSFSQDAAPFDAGSASPRLGLFVLVVDPSAFDDDYAGRAETHLQRLSVEHGIDVGRRRAVPLHVTVAADVLARLQRIASEGSTGEEVVGA
ncbi:Ldh family oxidoreductase [Microbacterium sp. NPDC089695]|uniref:Ldh family oxidoreductase n=1 Tax=Microbacterium sp. NPDC089695 TaxID=3364198 RepID=UPI003815A957